MNMTTLLTMAITAALLLPAVTVFTTLNVGKTRKIRVEEKRIISLSIVSTATVIFAIIAYMDFVGPNLYSFIESKMNEIVKLILENKEARFAFDLQNSSDTFATLSLKDTFKEISSIFPAMVFLWVALISVAEYNLIRLLLFRQHQGKYTLREFKLDYTQFIKFAIIYIIPRVLGGIYKNHILLNIAVNINVLLRILIILEGAAYVINSLAARAGKERIYQQIIGIGLIFIPYGHQALLIIGIFSIGFKMRDKLSQNTSKK